MPRPRCCSHSWSAFRWRLTRPSIQATRSIGSAPSTTTDAPASATARKGTPTLNTGRCQGNNTRYCSFQRSTRSWASHNKKPSAMADGAWSSVALDWASAWRARHRRMNWALAMAAAAAVITTKASVTRAMFMRSRCQAASACDSGKLTATRNAGTTSGRIATRAGAPSSLPGACTAARCASCSRAGAGAESTWPACARSAGRLSISSPSWRSRVITSSVTSIAWETISPSNAIGTSSTASTRWPPGHASVRARNIDAARLLPLRAGWLMCSRPAGCAQAWAAKPSGNCSPFCALNGVAAASVRPASSSKAAS